MKHFQFVVYYRQTDAASSDIHRTISKGEVDLILGHKKNINDFLPIIKEGMFQSFGLVKFPLFRDELMPNNHQ